ncbi:MAG: hypothetical protein JXX14_01735 [Deltaproteobacteria bacterium]|nr:hypothetical protein [Deltaproteobacteria bacterium]
MYNKFMVERTNSKWVDDLSAEVERQLRAQEELRTLMFRSLPYALDGKVAADDLASKALIETVSGTTLEYVQKNMDRYDGQSAFTTWALKIAVRLLLFELRLQRWREIAPEGVLPKIPLELHNQLAKHKFLQYTQNIFKKELTKNQHQAIQAMVMFRMPKEEVM